MTAGSLAPPAPPSVEVTTATVCVPCFLMVGTTEPFTQVRAYNDRKGDGQPQGDDLVGVAAPTGDAGDFELALPGDRADNRLLVLAVGPSGSRSSPATLTVTYAGSGEPQPAVSTPAGSVIATALRYTIRGAFLPGERVLLYRTDPRGSPEFAVAEAVTGDDGAFRLQAPLLADRGHSFAVGSERSRDLTPVPVITQDSSPPEIEILPPPDREYLMAGFDYTARIEDATPVSGVYLGGGEARALRGHLFVPSTLGGREPFLSAVAMGSDVRQPWRSRNFDPVIEMALLGSGTSQGGRVSMQGEESSKGGVGCGWVAAVKTRHGKPGEVA